MIKEKIAKMKEQDKKDFKLKEKIGKIEKNNIDMNYANVLTKGEKKNESKMELRENNKTINIVKNSEKIIENVKVKTKELEIEISDSEKKRIKDMKEKEEIKIIVDRYKKLYPITEYDKFMIEKTRKIVELQDEKIRLEYLDSTKNKGYLPLIEKKWWQYSKKTKRLAPGYRRDIYNNIISDSKRPIWTSNDLVPNGIDNTKIWTTIVSAESLEEDKRTNLEFQQIYKDNAGKIYMEDISMILSLIKKYIKEKIKDNIKIEYNQYCDTNKIKEKVLERFTKYKSFIVIKEDKEKIERLKIEKEIELKKEIEENIIKEKEEKLKKLKQPVWMGEKNSKNVWFWPQIEERKQREAKERREKYESEIKEIRKKSEELLANITNLDESIIKKYLNNSVKETTTGIVEPINKSEIENTFNKEIPEIEESIIPSDIEIVKKIEILVPKVLLDNENKNYSKNILPLILENEELNSVTKKLDNVEKSITKILVVPKKLDQIIEGFSIKYEKYDDKSEECNIEILPILLPNNVGVCKKKAALDESMKNKFSIEFEKSEESKNTNESNNAEKSVSKNADESNNSEKSEKSKNFNESNNAAVSKNAVNNAEKSEESKNTNESNNAAESKNADESNNGEKSVSKNADEYITKILPAPKKIEINIEESPKKILTLNTMFIKEKNIDENNIGDWVDNKLFSLEERIEFKRRLVHKIWEGNLIRKLTNLKEDNRDYINNGKGKRGNIPQKEMLKELKYVYRTISQEREHWKNQQIKLAKENQERINREKKRIEKFSLNNHIDDEKRNQCISELVYDINILDLEINELMNLFNLYISNMNIKINLVKNSKYYNKKRIGNPNGGAFTIMNWINECDNCDKIFIRLNVLVATFTIYEIEKYLIELKLVKSENIKDNTRQIYNSIVILKERIWIIRQIIKELTERINTKI